jgi:hypothetical protein
MRLGGPQSCNGDSGENKNSQLYLKSNSWQPSLYPVCYLTDISHLVETNYIHTQTLTQDSILKIHSFIKINLLGWLSSGFVAPCSLVEVYQTTQHYNPEDSHLHTHRHENLKS